MRGTPRNVSSLRAFEGRSLAMGWGFVIPLIWAFVTLRQHKLQPLYIYSLFISVLRFHHRHAHRSFIKRVGVGVGVDVTIEGQREVGKIRDSAAILGCIIFPSLLCTLYRSAL